MAIASFLAIGPVLAADIAAEAPSGAPSAVPSAAPSENQVWKIDPQQSVADFDVRALGVIPVKGRFVALDGAVTSAAIGGSVDVRVPVGQLQMRSKSRRNWALSEEFFDAERHPEIHFVALVGLPQMLMALEAGHAFDIDGQLNLRGQTRNQQFQVTHSSCRFELNAGCEIELSAAISRKRFGMAAHSFALADTVSMKIQLHLVKMVP